MFEHTQRKFERTVDVLMQPGLGCRVIPWTCTRFPRGINIDLFPRGMNTDLVFGTCAGDREEEGPLEEPELLQEVEAEELGDERWRESAQEWDTVAERGTASRPASTASVASVVPGEALGARDGDTRDVRHLDTDDVVQTVDVEQRRPHEGARDSSLRPAGVPVVTAGPEGVLGRPQRRRRCARDHVYISSPHGVTLSRLAA